LLNIAPLIARKAIPAPASCPPRRSRGPEGAGRRGGGGAGYYA